jgi:threonine dehydrogenase-like Zn-dependent dehydrogenase
VGIYFSVESICSLVSSGTELKVFNGKFEEAALDVNIKGMEDESMAYPLAYGYCLVGRVKRCGANVSSDEFEGKLVFAFAAHADRVIAHVNGIQVIPDGIAPEDAIFFPSVETALSIVHDAHVRHGENVAVFGQGLIGLLVTAILSTMGGSTTVSAFDTFPNRLAASSVLGATQALLPLDTSFQAAGPFDVSIEVSGNSRALQSAIDHTRSGGRIVIASWYGNDDVALKLGIDFHRSHKTLLTTQVSEIPATLAGLWNKQRRFGVTWELVKQLQPSKKLLTRTVALEEAQKAYELLDAGKELAVMFKYCRGEN